MKSKYATLLILVTLLIFFSAKSIPAVQVTVPGVPAYGYNVSPPPDGQPGIIGCGPTTAAMILKYYTDTAPAPGLIGNPLVDARTMHSSTYMNVNAQGMGAPSNFHLGIEKFANDRGYNFYATLHVEPTSFNPADYPFYTTVGPHPDVVTDATFWNTSTWDILHPQFLNFLKSEIDNGRPVSVTIDSGKPDPNNPNNFIFGVGDGIDDHWMVGVGYDLAADQWAGYNTWDSSIHWYDVDSAFILGNAYGVAYVRTFEYGGAVPEPATMLLLGSGLIGLAAYGRKRFFKK